MTDHDLSALELDRLRRAARNEDRERRAGNAAAFHLLFYALVGWLCSDATFCKVIIVDLVLEVMLRRVTRR